MGADTLQPLNLGTGMEILDAPDDDAEGSSFEDIYAFLLANSDIIITIDATSEESVRRGLSVVKHNHAKRLKNAGQKTEQKQIKFKVIEEVQGTEPKQIRLQIWLIQKASVQLHNMIVTEKDF